MWFTIVFAISALLLLLLLQKLNCAHPISSHIVITFIFSEFTYKFDLMARRKKRPQQSIYLCDKELKKKRTHTPMAKIQLQLQMDIHPTCILNLGKRKWAFFSTEFMRRFDAGKLKSNFFFWVYCVKSNTLKCAKIEMVFYFLASSLDPLKVCAAMSLDFVWSASFSKCWWLIGLDVYVLVR